MHVIVGAIFVLAGAAYVAYVVVGSAALELEPPFAALGVLLSAVGAGLWGRSRAASLIARAGLGVALLGIGAALVTPYLTPGSSRPSDDPVLHFRVLALASNAAVIVVLFLLVRRAPRAATFGTIDLLPLGGLVAALALAVIWLVGDEARLRPCRLGNDQACERVAVQLLETAERAPSAPPTQWEQRAARVLEERRCRVIEPWRCGVELYAAGTVAARAGRFEVAKQAFLRACDYDRGWCERAVQAETLPWTPDELKRLQRRPAR